MKSLLSKVMLVENQAKSFEDGNLYHTLVDSLQYLTITRPYVSFVINQPLQHMHNRLGIFSNSNEFFDTSKIRLI